MKRITGMICLLCGLSVAAQAQTEAIGINTENPRGVLHIDGSSNNPAAGAVDTLQASDDVLIDAEGRLGVGLAEPAAKVDIRVVGTGGAIRIRDGSEGAGKVLISDASGRGRWATINTGVWWYAALYTRILEYSTENVRRPFINYADSLVSSATQGSVDRAAGTITVPFAGAYRITLSSHYMSNRTGSTPYWALSELYVNGTVRWMPSTWGARSGNGTYPTYTVILNLQAGDVLNLMVVHEQAFSANREIVFYFMVELIQMQ
ncbi:MAG: hypothetical protein LBP25_03430 [Tannerellaceae bacterium]|jgi:hypothetical protein|nr:hypothetical protein [Tannerellaceae bacterium]